MLFNNKINTDYLKLSQIAYGGEFFYNLNKYRLKELNTSESKFKKVSDNLLKKIGNTSFYSYKNEDSGFVAILFENIKSKDLVIAYRGTERIGLGENSSDLIALGKDIKTDLNLVLANLDEQFDDAYEFYKLVKKENPKAKIVILGQSLGGALAQLVAAKVYSTKNQKLKTYTYNAPGCKHMLEIFDCSPNLNYSFVTNYAVMNDWCGMFGENIGETYLIPPIPPNAGRNLSAVEALENVLLTSHEGIFNYSGKVIKKPKNFNQPEGLALWYFDRNNPMKDFKTPSDFIKSVVSPIDTKQISNVSESLKNKLESMFEEQSRTVKQLTTSIHTATCDFIENQTDKIIDGLNNNTFNQMGLLLDKTFSEISTDSLEEALKFLKSFKIHKKQPEYFNGFKSYIEK